MHMLPFGMSVFHTPKCLASSTATPQFRKGAKLSLVVVASVGVECLAINALW